MGAGSGYPIAGEAAASLARVERLVTRDLPLLVDTAALRRTPRWSATLVYKAAADAPISTLDGPSYGGAMALAAASRLLAAPAPHDLACSAAVTERGELAPVAHLDAKLRLIAGCAPGVRRFVVAASQLLEAQRALDAVGGPGIQVVGLRGLADLLEVAFEPVLTAARAGWRGARAEKVAEHLFRLAMEGSPLLAWRHVARAARLVVRGTEPRSRARRLALFARAVALRHEGERVAPLPWPSDRDLRTVPRVVQQTWLAHVVQAHCDAGDVRLDRVLIRAKARLPRTLADCHDGDLRLLGSVGRGLARLRHYDEAARVLAEVVDGWFGIFRPADASHAICELLRVQGIRRDRAAVEQTVVRAAVVAAEPDCDGVGRSFLALAAGRALVQAGSSAAALPWLETRDLALGRGGVEAAGLRWRARALAELGRSGEAATVRTIIGRVEGARVQALLARLDAALARGELGRREAMRVAMAARHHTALLLADTPPGAIARVVAEEYPY